MRDTIKGFRGKDGPILLDYSGVANVPGAIQSIGALTAQPGDHFEVETVDGTGRVVTVKAVAKPGGGSGQNLALDTTLTQSGTAADAKATGDEIKRVEDKIPSIEGLAKSEDIPTKPEDIGAQPKGNYLTMAPVESVNGKTGAVELGAEDVGARSADWMPTAQEVGALPNTYTPPNQTAEQVGADPKGTAASAVSAHNASTDAHTDLRLAVQKLQAAVNAFMDVDDTTRDSLSEVLALIDANADVIESITTGKVSVSDIINNLTTNVANKPLSAAQGVVLKGLIDGLSASLANYQPKGDYALASAVPTKVSQLQNDAKYLTAVTAAMITAALGYTPINPGLATLARHTDGLLYLFVDGKPVGSGVELPTGGIDGYVDADNNIVVRGLDEGVTYKFYFELADGSLVEGGELVYDNTVYYTVTNALTNCTISNSATQVIEGESYAATITAKSGYELKSVVVTMGGSPVTVSGGNINIASVSGNIVITAVAEEKVVTPSYTNLADPTSADWAVGKRFDGSGGLKNVDAGVNGATTNYIGGDFAVGDTIRIKGLDLSGSSYRTAVYNKNKELQSLATLSGQGTYFSDIVANSTAASFKIKSNMPSDGYIRFSGVLNGTSADVIITRNEEIA